MQKDRKQDHYDVIVNATKEVFCNYENVIKNVELVSFCGIFTQIRIFHFTLP